MEVKSHGGILLPGGDSLLGEAWSRKPFVLYYRQTWFMYILMYSSDIEISRGKAGPVVCEDWYSWAILMLVCLLQG